MKTFYQHIKFACGAVVTIAASDNKGIAKIGYAWCSPTDNFVRAKGRLLAEGRMNSKKFLWEMPVEDNRPYTLLGAAKKLLREHSVDIWPSRPWAEEAYEEFVNWDWDYLPPIETS